MAETIKLKVEVDVDSKDLKDVNKNLDETGKKAEQSKKGIGGMSTAFKGVGTAIKAAGIGIVLGLFAALFNLLKKNQAVMDFLNKATKTLEILFNKLTSSIGPLKDALVGVFENPQQAVKDLWEVIKTNVLNRITGLVDTFKFLGKTIQAALDLDWAGVKAGAAGVGESLLQVATGVDDLPNKMLEVGKAAAKGFGDAWDASDKFVEKQNELILAEGELNKFIAKNKATMNELKLVRDDETASMGDRIAAAEKINELVAEEEARSIALQEAKLEQMRIDLKATNTTVEDKKRLMDAEAELDNLRADSATKLRENQMKINSLRKLAGDQNTELTQQEIVEANAASAEAVRIEEEKLKKLEELKIASNQRIKDLRLQWAIEDAGTEDELYQAQLDKEQARFDEAMVIAGENAEMIANAEEENTKNKEKLLDEHKKKEIDAEKKKSKEKMAIAQMALGAAKAGLNAYGDYLDMQMNKELKGAEGNAAKQEQIRKEYGKKKKNAAYIGAIIDTASAVMQALSSFPPPFSYIMAAISAAAGAIQIATISQQQFAKGGILSGPKHAQGGIASQFGELEGGEGIINAASMSNPSLRNLASTANRAGGGNDFSTGDGSVQLSAASISAIGQAFNDKKVYVSETDITTTQNKVKVVEQEAVL